MTAWVGQLQRLISEITAAGPWWIAQKNVGAFLESVAVVLDQGIETLHTGLLLTRPLDCDESALPVLSRDRGISVYASEPAISQRHRLSQWQQLRRQRGTHQGEMRNIQPYFLDRPVLPRLRIVHQAGNGLSSTWHTLDSTGVYTRYRATPSNWNWDGVQAKWSRFWVILYTDGLALPPQPTWDGGELWDGGSVWDGFFSTIQNSDLVAGIREAKAAHSQLWGFAIAESLDTFNPAVLPALNADGSWSHPNGQYGNIVDPVTGKPTRDQGAVWIYDLGHG